MQFGIKTEARRSASRDQKQMFLIVGHLATPLSEAAFASVAARCCSEAMKRDYWSVTSSKRPCEVRIGLAQRCDSARPLVHATRHMYLHRRGRIRCHLNRQRAELLSLSRQGTQLLAPIGGLQFEPLGKILRPG
jgi:hypothetical protein